MLMFYNFTSTNERLMCSECGKLYIQYPEMTRHKQDEHGHPRRGDKDVAKKKIPHTVVTLAEDSTTEPEDPTPKSRRSSCHFDPESNIMLQDPLENADGLCIPDWNSPSDCTGIESLFCVSHDFPHDNPYHMPSGLTSRPDQFFGEHDPFAPAEPPATAGQDPSRYTSPFHHEFTLPEGAQFADSLEEEQAPSDNVAPVQTETSAATDESLNWEDLSSEEQMAFIVAHPDCLEPSSLAPPPLPFSDDVGYYMDWMGVPPQDNFLFNLSDSTYQDMDWQYSRF